MVQYILLFGGLSSSLNNSANESHFVSLVLEKACEVKFRTDLLVTPPQQGSSAAAFEMLLVDGSLFQHCVHCSET